MARLRLCIDDIDDCGWGEILPPTGSGWLEFISKTSERPGNRPHVFIIFEDPGFFSCEKNCIFHVYRIVFVHFGSRIPMRFHQTKMRVFVWRKLNKSSWGPLKKRMRFFWNLLRFATAAAVFSIMPTCRQSFLRCHIHQSSDKCSAIAKV